MRKTEAKYLKTIVLCLWAPSAYATSVTLGSSLAGVPLLAWALVTVLSTVSGLAALLNKLKNTQPERTVLFISAHMLGSLLAGLLVFLTLSGMGSGIHDFLQTVIISIGAYGGAALLDTAAETLSAKVKSYGPKKSEVE